MRFQLLAPPTPINAPALDAALHQNVTFYNGFAASGPSQPIQIFLNNGATTEHKLIGEAIFHAHDPVFLSVDKSTVTADGVDAITITVQATLGAAPVSLQLVGPQGLSQIIAVPLSQGLSAYPGNMITGTVTFNTRIAGPYTLTMVSGYNRNVDVNILQAV